MTRLIVRLDRCVWCDLDDEVGVEGGGGGPIDRAEAAGTVTA
jgi:hypothetical protein